jgi:hypothetical protein
MDFESLDADKDGQLTSEELSDGLVAAGGSAEEVDAAVETMMHVGDVDHDGALDLAEFEHVKSFAGTVLHRHLLPNAIAGVILRVQRNAALSHFLAEVPVGDDDEQPVAGDAEGARGEGGAGEEVGEEGDAGGPPPGRRRGRAGGLSGADTDRPAQLAAMASALVADMKVKSTGLTQTLGQL